jgi:hypothetical protein
MASHAETLRTRVDRPTGRATTAPRTRRPDASGPARDGRGATFQAKPSMPQRRPPPQADHGLTLLIIFTSSALLVVALVVLAGAVGQMWILVPIMIIDFAVTAAVLLTVAKLLGGSNS